MSTTYSVIPSLRGDFQANATAQMTKMGVMMIAQNFINAYMSPSDQGDLHNRLGTLISISKESTTVSDYSFPPFNIDSTHASLGVRVGGFKQLNDQINKIQNLYRSLTGEIRTKITEWDLSLYLQEPGWATTTNGDISYVNEATVFDLSLLYRIFLDNPSQYITTPGGTTPDTRALVYGLINASLHYQYKSALYNPSADPDLSQWVPPTDDLLAYQVAPSGHMVTTGGGQWWEFWKRSSSYWVWDVPVPKPINDWQKNQVAIATSGGWDSWSPPLWKLFFYSDSPATITSDDYPAITAHLNDLAAARHPNPADNQPRTKSQNTLFVAPTNILPTTGINLTSPIWRGLPYGRYPDTRSIQGYFNNTDITTAKIDITKTPDTNINKSYPYGNPFDGIDKLLNGWISSYPVTVYTEVFTQVLVPGVPGTGGGGGGGGGDHGTPDIPEHYEPRYISVPTTTIQTVAQSPCVFPLALGGVTAPSSSRRMITKVTFGFAEISNGGNGGDHGNNRGNNGGSYRSSTATWGTTNVEQTIDPTTTLQINNFEGDGASQINAILTDGIAKPVVLVGAPESGKPRFVIIAPIQKVQVTVTTYTSYSFFGLFSWSIPSSSQQWVYQIDMAQGQGFSIDNDSNTISGAPLPLDYFAAGDKRIEGVFFRLDARSLSPSDNIITAGWTGVGNIPNSIQGSAIATALLNPMWWNGSTFNRSPLCKILSPLKTVVFSPASDILSTLSVLFSPNSAEIINSVVSQLSLEVQNSPIIKSAVKTLTDSPPGSLLSQVEHFQSSYTVFMSAINNLINNPGVYDAGDIQTFYNQFPVIMGGLLSPTMKNALNAYLEILYSARLAIIPQRMNKQNGTLINIARTEFALALMQDSLATPPSFLDPFTPEKLIVVHEVTNISLNDRATMVAKDLPIEKVQIVYVAVEYTSSGDVIRPQAGNYQFISQEILDNSSLNPAEWYITFDASDARCPIIMKDVITTIDGSKLQQIMVDTSLSALEKICWARVLADWWVIPIPTDAQPLAIDYVTSLQLVLAAPTAIIDQYLQFIGGGTLSPVIDSITKLQVSPTAVADPKMQEILRARNA